ncbi:TetR/AcrR family transcriptional regulator [Lewinella sp. W8]|uniref:TetR/AcrR family transcriptional regulator n=1 Tax=Lewinella sp. W8 TaxID=2528208 RepID=UPI001067D2D1|nr:TetR/AcrR family transcriptional regulator [Lewinella sp. W8]MTB52363.1 TetR family transcriptional regulator [Lewinella sp. W8]
MRTKERILAQARELFNAGGIQGTTLRQIASALGMSQGNLNYHFRTKEDIVNALYFSLVEEINTGMEAMTQNFSILSSLYLTAEKTMRVFYAYRFILRDLYFIFREHAQIREHYLGLQAVRKQQFEHLFRTMVEKGIIRPEEFDGEYKRLYERMAILGDNWINSAELFRADDGNAVKYYQDLSFEMIYPYLTQAGKEQYAAVRSLMQR